MTKILAVFLLAVGVVGCIVVGLTVVLVFNINLKTFLETKDNKIPQTDYGLRETAATMKYSFESLDMSVEEYVTAMTDLMKSSGYSVERLTKQ